MLIVSVFHKMSITREQSIITKLYQFLLSKNFLLSNAYFLQDKTVKTTLLSDRQADVVTAIQLLATL